MVSANEHPIRFILASSSPRRRELLEGLGLAFIIHPSEADEDVPVGTKPAALVEMLSLRKAQAVAQYYEQGLVIGSDTIVVLEDRILGKPVDEEDAFTMLSQIQGRTHTVFSGVAIVDAKSGEALVEHQSTQVTMRSLSEWEIRKYIKTGEPMDKAGGYDTTMHLGDIGQYRIISESPDGRPEIIVGHTVSKVTFRPMSDEEIWAYVKTGDPLDKAGAYGVQGIGSVFIEKIEGDFYSIMGLPLNLLYQMLLMFGISLFNQS